jgi:hypothetical protein
MNKLSVLWAGLILGGCGGGMVETSSAPASAPPAQVKAVSNLAAFMGDSITQLWNVPAYDQNPTLNLGISGQTTVQMLARFGDVMSSGAGVVVIFLRSRAATYTPIITMNS